uniref:Superoxide dismutase copper/zinc binding domain-containing protein n=1 Tax=Trieres chinensis TaxID=1514140 RepID=A0A7S2EXU4_TRICV
MVIAQSVSKMAKCSCSLTGEGPESVSGLLRLSQASEDGPTIIEGEIKGLTAGKHAISVNVYGDLTQGLAGCGVIFNPFGKNHGAPEDDERMVGDLGNVVTSEDGKCLVQIEDRVLKLIGPHSVIGRSIVVYAGEDDCGRGGHELSLTTGNSGGRVAAGVIGIAP